MKKIYLFLAVIILFGLFFISCGNNDENKNNTPKEIQEANIDNNISDEAVEIATEKLLPNVPDDKNFDGYEFVILGNSTDYNTYWYSKDIYVEEETGDTIQDAVYYRNRAIEEKYNISIKGVFKGTV